MRRIAFENADPELLFGHHEGHLRLVEQAFGVAASARGQEVFLEGDAEPVARAEVALLQLAELHEQHVALDPSAVLAGLRLLAEDPSFRFDAFFRDGLVRVTPQRSVTARSLNQKVYVERIRRHDLVFGIGVAGTGKTYLAVAMAVQALTEKKVKRIILARPAVEAGEKLGFLPGDLYQKVDPFLRPLYDALHDMLDSELVERLLARGVIEVAPIAFMRGRTLNDSFVILDEAQNTTVEQMKMFLTRIGFNSKAVVNGDVTQVDLPPGRVSGLAHARQVIAAVSGVAFVEFDSRDVVRHPLVQRIIEAYARVQKPVEPEVTP